MKTFSKPLSSLLALLVSASALVAQPANDNSPTGEVAGGFGVNAALYHKVKVKTTDTYFYVIEAGGGASFASELPSQADNNNSPKPKNPAKQDSIKRDQLVALTIEQYSLLTKKDQYKGSPNIYALNMEIYDVDFSNTLALASLFETEEECQLELLQKNLGVDQKITLENIDQFLTEQEANSFHAIQAQLPKGTLYLAPEVKANGIVYHDYSSSSSVNDLQSWYDKTNKYKLAAHFFELEYLNFLVLNRLGVNVLPADERPSYDEFTLKLANYNYSNFHSDDLLNLEEKMICVENEILYSQNAGTKTPETPVTSPANDQPVATSNLQQPLISYYNNPNYYNPANISASLDDVAASADFNQNFEKAVGFPAITEQP